MSIVSEIIDACYERVREFGPGHEIRQWPLTRTEWDAFIDELSQSRIGTLGNSKWTGNSVTIQTQVGEVRVFIGP